MLRACRRLLRGGGRTAFHVITTPPGLTAAERRRARQLGPFKVSVDHDYPTLLRSVGFVDVRETDITAELRDSLVALLEWSARRERDLRSALGDELFEQRRGDRQAHICGIDSGLLRRSMVVASVPMREPDDHRPD